MFLQLRSYSESLDGAFKVLVSFDGHFLLLNNRIMAH